MIRETILLEGMPASSPRGYLGWATSLLLETGGARVVVDCGAPGDRHVLLRRLREISLDPAAVDVLVLTHLHFDHCLNLDVFPGARIIVSAREIAYVESGEYRARDDTGIPPYVLGLLAPRDVRAVHLRTAEQSVAGSVADRETADGSEWEAAVAPGVTLVATPGHTPGSLSVLYEADGIPTAACADLVKNAREFLVGPLAEEGRRSLSTLRARAQRFVPGHDRPFRVVPSGIAYEGVRSLEISVMSDPSAAETVPARWVLD